MPVVGHLLVGRELLGGASHESRGWVVGAEGGIRPMRPLGALLGSSVLS